MSEFKFNLERMLSPSFLGDAGQKKNLEVKSIPQAVSHLWVFWF